MHDGHPRADLRTGGNMRAAGQGVGQSESPRGKLLAQVRPDRIVSHCDEGVGDAVLSQRREQVVVTQYGYSGDGAGLGHVEAAHEVEAGRFAKKLDDHLGMPSRSENDQFFQVRHSSFFPPAHRCHQVSRCSRSGQFLNREAAFSSSLPTSIPNSRGSSPSPQLRGEKGFSMLHRQTTARFSPCSSRMGIEKEVQPAFEKFRRTGSA